jgi:hypothetical protein
MYKTIRRMTGPIDCVVVNVFHGDAAIVFLVVAVVPTATAAILFGLSSDQGRASHVAVAFVDGRVAGNGPHGGSQFHFARNNEVDGRPLHIGTRIAITMEAGSSGCPSFPALRPTLEDEVQDEHDYDGENDDGRGPKAQDILHLEKRMASQFFFGWVFPI